VLTGLDRPVATWCPGAGGGDRTLCKQEVTGSIQVGSIFLVGKQTQGLP
jgi:hypothetical protein